ncbi:MAG TPA: 3-dehydroquinate synthase [Candidatus Methylacidiphilales bacterium]|nr:3-dehydroquinate synthase [Candidatus Methylacidiphilales bacterium]
MPQHQEVQEVQVSTSSGIYTVRIGRGLLDGIGADLATLNLGKSAVVIADETLAPHLGPKVMASLQNVGIRSLLVSVPSGEGSKNMNEVARLLSFLAQHRLERNSVVIALGGGMTGDLAGFVASIYLRGVPFVQLPTTLLAMVDSSVGGKTGVNLPEGKNLVGAFCQPRLVLADWSLLQSLPEREIRSGMAEIIKYGVIADANLFATVADGLPSDIGQMIRRCVEIKADVVAEDEFETTGTRALLNFGHTLGHAIEQAAQYELRHGEAIAIGMRAAAHLSARHAGMPAHEVRAIEKAIAANGLPLRAPGLAPSKLWDIMARDKKVLAGTIRWVLSNRIGHAELISGIPRESVEQAIALVTMMEAG